MCFQATTACVETSWHVASPILQAASPPTVLFKVIEILPDGRHHILGYFRNRDSDISSRNLRTIESLFLHLSCHSRRRFFFSQRSCTMLESICSH